MALSASMVWEIRTAGSAVNGGGFNPNNAASNTTDYSQQAAAQYTFTDLASTNGTSASPQVTSASHSFVTADVGNVIHINSGTSWTVGWYEIISVSGGAATLDRACGTAATLTAGTYHVGGALNLNSGTMSSWAGSASGTSKVWIKNDGTHQLGTSMTIGGNSAATILTIEGYNATRGDSPTGSNRPTLSTATNTQSYTWGGYLNLKNIISIAQPNIISTSAMIFNGLNNSCFNCKFYISTTSSSFWAVSIGGSSSTATGDQLFVNCEFACPFGVAIAVTSSAALSGLIMIGCHIHDSNIGIGVQSGTNLKAIEIINCIFDGCYGSAISYAGQCESIIYGNTFYGYENKIGIGINATISTADRLKVYNNVFYGLATGITFPIANGIPTSNYNAFFNNTTDRTNWITGSNDLALNPQFQNVAQVTGTTASVTSGVLTQTGANFSNVTDNQDYCYISAGTGPIHTAYLITAHTTTTLTLSPSPTNSSSNVTFQVTTGRNWAIGSNMVNAGYPGSVPPGTVTGYLDIGASQAHYTDPGTTNVKTGTNYTFANALKSGTSPSVGSVPVYQKFSSGKPKQSLS